MRKQAAFADTLKKGSKVAIRVRLVPRRPRHLAPQVFVTKKGVETIATVVKIHRDDPEELYVTVRDASGQECQAVWKSNFGRPTPSTRCWPYDCV